MSPTSRVGRWRGKGMSVGTKLAVTTVALLAVVSVGVYFVLSRSLAQTLLTSKGAAAEEVGLLFAANVSAAVVFEDPDVIAEALKNLAKNESVTFAAVWSSTPDEVGKQLSKYARGESEQRVPLVKADVPRLTWAFECLSLSVPIVDEAGKIVARGLIEFSLAGENAKIAATSQRVLVTSSAAALAIALLLLFVSRRTVVIPLRRLQAGARQVERGESAVFDFNSDDEVGDLARALTQMAGAIGEREDEIRRRNRDMRLVMDNVGQGFLTLDEHGVMSDEYSLAVADWFGKPGLHEQFATYLKRVEPQFASWFAMAFQQLQDDLLPIELAIAQSPKRLVHDGRTWSFEYRPLPTPEGRFEGLIVVISDVTHLLAKAAAERNQQEVIVALTSLRHDPQGFLDFLKEAEALLVAIEGCEDEDFYSALRHLHTLKGIASMVELHSIVECCHELEEQHLEHPGPLTPEQKTELRQRWLTYRGRVEPLLPSAGETGIFIDRARYSAFREALAGERPESALLTELASWAWGDTDKPLERLGQHAEQLATRLNKGSLTLEIESSGVRIPPDACSGLWSALVHAVRNAVDHGLESTTEREARGKPPNGRLRLATSWQGEELVISVADDGRGIDWRAIAERAKQLGVPHETQAELNSALLSERLTTRVGATETSGRGMGTAALDQTVKQLGGHIEIESTLGTGTTFRFMIPRERVFAGEHDPFNAPSGKQAKHNHAA